MSVSKPIRGAQLNPAHPLARGLVAAYLFNEHGGALTTNLVSRDAAVITSGSWSGEGLVLAQSGYVSDAGVKALTESITVFGRGRLTPAASGGYVCGQGTGAQAWQIFTEEYGWNRLGFGWGGGMGSQRSTFDLPITGCFAVTHIKTGGYGSALKFYVRNSVESYTVGGTAIAGSSGFDIGSNYAGSSLMNGALECLYLWERQLSPEEIRLLNRSPYILFERISPAKYFGALAPPAANWGRVLGSPLFGGLVLR